MASKKEKPGIGDVISFDEKTSRRKFLKSLSVVGLSYAGLRKAIGKAHGKEPEGVPLIRTVRGPNMPASVELIHRKQHRAIQKYDSINEAKKFGDSVHSVMMENRSPEPGDIQIRAFVNRNTHNVRKRNPNRINGIPVTYEEEKREIESEPNKEEFSVSSSFEQEEDLKSGVAVNGMYDEYPGTLGLVVEQWYSGWNTRTLLITANHVVTRDSDPTGNSSHELYQPLKPIRFPPRRGRQIGTHYDTVTSHDVAAYEFNGSGTAHHQEIKTFDEPITEAWTYQGLRRAVSNFEEGGQQGQIDTEYYGRKTDRGNTETVKVKREKSMNGGDFDYVAVMGSSPSENGDSGCPFVTEKDNGELQLVGILHGAPSAYGNSHVMVPSSPNGRNSFSGWMEDIGFYLDSNP